MKLYTIRESGHSQWIHSFYFAEAQTWRDPFIIQRYNNFIQYDIE